jgi:hypothetical protein
MRMLYNTSLLTENKPSRNLSITEVHSQCATTFPPVSDGYKISDQYLICYIEIHTDDPQQYSTHGVKFERRILTYLLTYDMVQDII